jgi:uncharacterized protein
MKQIFPALVVGLLFGAGLALSDMINPARVLAFLDVAGDWDPTLAYVMVAALVPSALGYWASRRMRRPLFGSEFRIPPNRAVEPKLVVGASIFGIGWGLVGFCPGPAIAALAFRLWQPWLFAASMVTGMLIHRLYNDRVLHRKRQE